MLTAGETFGHYQIESVLGRGGMGTVYKALDTQLKRTVALKVINEDLAHSEKYQQRLKAEAKKVGQIDSPYVVKAWDYGEFNGRPYITFEYIEGVSLRELLPELDFYKKIELATKILNGVSSAHKKYVIHRDLKPENIRVTPEGLPKILDFGLALSTSKGDTVDATGNIEGTVEYASPEQLSGEATSSKSDLFSFGVILYEMFTSELPFKGAYSASTIYSILYEDPEPPAELNDEIPGWLNDLIIKLLQKNPSERFIDATEVLRYVEDNMSGTGERVLAAVARKRKTVTVVHLKNLSSDSSWDYFCQGFTEEVINEVNRRTDLIISAQPESSLPKDIKEVFKRCRTDFVLTGSLMNWQNQIRLSLTVYGDRGGQVISTKKHEGPSEQLFSLLSQAAQDVADILADVTGSSAKELAATPSPDVSAYDYYLKGRNYYQTNKPEDLIFAENMFKKALDIDPTLAIAHTGLADVYAFQYMAFYDHSSTKIELAKKEAEMALEVNPNLPEAHRSLGRYYMFTANPVKAEKEYTKAIYINPKYAVGYRTLAWLKSSTGDLDEALNWARKALELAPTDLETLLLLSLIHMDSRKYTLALATLQRATELGPDYGRAYYNLGSVYMKLGVPDLALENFLLAIKYQGDPNSFIDAGYIYLLQKNYEVAKEMFKQSITQGHLKFAAYYHLGLAERFSGSEDKAIEQFEKVISTAEEQINSQTKNDHLLSFQAKAYASIGNVEKAREILDALSTQKQNTGEILCFIAQGYSLIGDNDNCRKYLHQSLQMPDGPTEKEVKLDPHFLNIQD